MRPSKKVKILDELVKIIKQKKKQGKKIVHCHGCFDLMHPGHIKHFEAAKELGDVLVVTVTPDKFVNKGPGRPVYNQKLRTESIASLGVVDFVAINKWTDAVPTIKLIKPDFFVKDNEFKEAKDNPKEAVAKEARTVESVGGKLHFTSELRFSSSHLLNKFFGLQSEEAEMFLEKFRKIYSAEDIIAKIKEFEKMKVLVIGDTIIDDYHYVQPMGKVPKANTIAASYISEERFAGGAIACANHIAGFCKNVDLVTCIGKEKGMEDFIRGCLKKNIQADFFCRPDAPTVVKRRFVDPAFMGKLFEVYFYDDTPLNGSIENEIINHLEDSICSYDLVLVADFGHGFIGPRLIDFLCEKSKFMAVNTQSNTGNYGFNLVTKYPKADYVCLDEPEVRLACHSKFGNMKDILEKLKAELRCERIVATRGHKNTATLGKEGFLEIPIFSSKIVDTVGAGDTFFSITAPGAVLGWPADLLAFVGNVAGALAVGIVGNRSSVSFSQLFRFMSALLK
ncbi:MAG: adenylyltransferase/cytidyltransferase family protein [Candidatus Marinimicrobia bacterium]|nr:adenylyltransferase/cytidyltransferase family protein [Candidatus Neomarinimicrobiota bacterium]